MCGSHIARKVCKLHNIQIILYYLSAKSSLILGENKAAFCGRVILMVVRNVFEIEERLRSVATAESLLEGRNKGVIGM